MKTGNRWLIAGMTGALLLSSSAARAQNPGDVPTAPIPGAGAGAGPIGSFQAPAPIRMGQALSVLVFPFGYAAAEAPAAADPAAGAPAGLSVGQLEVASYLTAAVKAGLLSSPYYAVASYHPQSSLVQRGRKDDILRPEHLVDLVSPTTGAVDAEKAKLITYRLGMQTYMVGTIESKEDPKTNTVEVTLETQLVDSTTGQVLRSAAVSGAAAGAEGVPVGAVRERAALDAAQKALPALGIQLVPLASSQPAKAAVKKGKMTPAERKAEREQKAIAEKAEKAEKARKREEDKARREAEKAARASGDRSVQRDERSATLVAQAQPPAAGAAVEVGPNSVPGYTNAAGQPVPYGYALGDTKEALPQRKKRGLRLPSWLGVSGFLTALSILL